VCCRMAEPLEYRTLLFFLMMKASLADGIYLTITDML